MAAVLVGGGGDKVAGGQHLGGQGGDIGPDQGRRRKEDEVSITGHGLGGQSQGHFVAHGWFAAGGQRRQSGFVRSDPREGERLICGFQFGAFLSCRTVGCNPQNNRGSRVGRDRTNQCRNVLQFAAAGIDNHLHRLGGASSHCAYVGRE